MYSNFVAALNNKKKNGITWRSECRFNIVIVWKWLFSLERISMSLYFNPVYFSYWQHDRILTLRQSTFLHLTCDFWNAADRIVMKIWKIWIKNDKQLFWWPHRGGTATAENKNMFKARSLEEVLFMFLLQKWKTLLSNNYVKLSKPDSLYNMNLLIVCKQKLFFLFLVSAPNNLDFSAFWFSKNTTDEWTACSRKK